MPVSKGDIVTVNGITYMAIESTPDDVKPPAYPYKPLAEPSQLIWRGGVTYTPQEIREGSDGLVRELLIHLMNQAVADGKRIAELERQIDRMREDEE